MCDHVLLTPADTLQFRGNRRFAAGVYGSALMPPWPSVFAGALRSAALTQRAVPFVEFMAHRTADAAVVREIGTGPLSPGTFRVGGIALARRSPSETMILPEDVWLPLPADLVATEEQGTLRALPREPVAISATFEVGLPDSLLRLPGLPTVKGGLRLKPLGGCWISLAGLDAHLSGRPLPPGVLAAPEALYTTHSRLGIALDGRSRAAAPGLLYTSEEISLRSGLGFLIPVWGATETLPRQGLAQLGGDARGVRVQSVQLPPDVRLSDRQLPTGPHFRIILATPAIFASTTGKPGWLPPGVVEDPKGRFLLRRGGLTAELVAAALGRPQVVSGWDLAKGGPKPAVRAVPAGAVYWFRNLNPAQADLSPLADCLREGWWPADDVDTARRAEGFNSIWLGAWSPSDPKFLETTEA